MTIGSLSERNMEFLKNHKKIGYSTMTRLIDEALSLMRRNMEAEIRNRKLMEAAQSYKEDNAWQEIEGDDYL